MQKDLKQRVDQVINNLSALPAVPEVASKVINMVNNPDVSFKQVSEEISKDQSMTTNILKLANSAFFSKGKEISSIDRAMVTLGLKEVKDIVMVVATKPVLNKPLTGYGLEEGELWRQGLLVASMSKTIAIMKKNKDIADIVFTGGIIHNVGKVILALFVQQAFKSIMEQVTTNNLKFVDAERAVIGYSHQEIGEQILSKWKFPPVLKAIVRYYQEPDFAPAEYRREVSIVHVANALTLMSGVGIGNDGLYHELSDSAIQELKLTPDELERLYARIPEMLSGLSDIL